MRSNLADQLQENLQYKSWNRFLKGEMHPEEVVVEYLMNGLSFQFLRDNQELFSEEKIQYAITGIVKNLLKVSVFTIRGLLKQRDDIRPVTAKNIPQFSNFASATIYIPEVLSDRKAPLTYKELGYVLYAESKSDDAATKYGENHGKLAALLDLAALRRNNGSNVFESTLLTESFCRLDESKKIELIRRLCYRIPMVQQAVISENPELEMDKLLKRVLAYSTYLRRRSNAMEILAFALEE